MQAVHLPAESEHVIEVTWNDDKDPNMPGYLFGLYGSSGPWWCGVGLDPSRKAGWSSEELASMIQSFKVVSVPSEYTRGYREGMRVGKILYHQPRAATAG